ncbi:MAG: DM13 domain-containing protein [Anaerolineae bacterium]|nr:DM13 domain-containing protein [Anaerolineae bacterium]
MNTQRWIAVGMVALLVMCILSSNLWLTPLLEREDEDPTPTPTATLSAESELFTATPTVDVILTLTPEPTLDPIVAEILEELEFEEDVVGIDPYVVLHGDFTIVDSMHRGEGTASIYKISEQQYVLRLDPFNVTNGPDLRVILSQHEMPRTSTEALLPDYLDLGALQNALGAQNYEIPETESIDKYNSVVIYSMSLNVVYTSATLEDVRGQ